MDKIQIIKNKLIRALQYLEFRWLWYQLSQDERREWLQDMRYRAWRRSQDVVKR
jgi:hypothetical protein